MNFLEQENMLDDINAQIESSKQKLSNLRGGEKDKSNIQFKEYVKKLIDYLENFNDNSNKRRVTYQIKKLEEYL